MGYKNKKAKSDVVHAKKSVPSTNPFANATPATSKKMNPFEVHVNKEKFQILGRTCKHDKGLPGVSRAKALKKRSETLGKEFLQKHKTNRFLDNRIGRNLTGDQLTESVMNARFLADQLSQIKQQNKASKFNLNDDELLTHRGQTLEDIEQFRDERSDDEGLDDERLDADFTEVANFGGEDSGEKDRKSAIEEMIQEQKRRKMEIAKEKDEVHTLTEKLDADYKELVSLVGKVNKDENKTKPPPDDYDKLLKEMIFEPRGSVADKLLTAEEQAKQERERLERLENDRLRRMRADDEGDENNKQTKHRSADDLDDGYFLGGDAEDDETLAYDLEGNLGGKVNNNEAKKDIDNEDASDQASDNSNEDDESDEDSGSEDDDADDLSDLKVTDTEDEGEESVPVEKEEVKKKTKRSSEETTSTKPSTTNIPYTIKMPKTYEDFLSLIDKHTPEDQQIIIERLIKCNHPKLDGVNREHVVKLFAFLMQYINELFADATQENIQLHFRILNGFMPLLYDLVHLNPDRMSNTLLDVIKEKYTEYNKNPRVFPPLETVIYFKLVANLYSTSDFRHPIATPTYIFMQHILSRARVRSRQDIAIGLFIVTVALEFGQRSKRFLPSVLNFLLGIVYLSVPKRPMEIVKIVPPFESTGTMNKLLTIAEAEENKTVPEQRLLSEDLVMTTFSLDFKIRALNMSLQLIKDAVENVSEHIGSNYLAMNFIPILERLPLQAYPDYIRVHYDAALATLQQVAQKPLKKLVPPEKKPKALRLLEPRIETVYDDKRRPKMSKEKEERAKLLTKIKREKKGAMREIRRDTAFVQDIRLKQQLQSDKERHEKVKRIYQEAAVQQGELNELSRAKKRKKF